jgi:LysM repeat protein
MTRNTGTDRKTKTTARTVAKVAIAGMVVGAPLAAFAGTASAAPASGGHNWDAVAQCESGGNWSINTGNGFSGGLQFTPSTWSAYGGQGSPQNASKSQQIQVAEKVLAGQGAGAWPVCGKNLGAAGTSSSTSSAPAVNTYSAPKQSAPKQSAPKQSFAPTNSAPKHPAAKAGADYTVKSGDTMSKIAQAQGVQGGYQALFNLNRDTVANVNIIFVGQQLALR